MIAARSRAAVSGVRCGGYHSPRRRSAGDPPAPPGPDAYLGDISSAGRRSRSSTPPSGERTAPGAAATSSAVVHARGVPIAASKSSAGSSASDVLRLGKKAEASEDVACGAITRMPVSADTGVGHAPKAGAARQFSLGARDLVGSKSSAGASLKTSGLNALGTGSGEPSPCGPKFGSASRRLPSATALLYAAMKPAVPTSAASASASPPSRRAGRIPRPSRPSGGVSTSEAPRPWRSGGLRRGSPRCSPWMDRRRASAARRRGGTTSD